MKKGLSAALVSLCFLSAPAWAFAGLEDLKVGAALTGGSSSGFGVGARVEYALDVLLPNLGVAGGVNVFFPSDPYDGWWEINAAALYRFEVTDWLTPYAGGGLAFASWKKQYPDDEYSGFSSQRPSEHHSSFAVNAIGGCTFDFDIGFTPFVEVRGGVGGGNGLEITAGALIGF